MWDSLGFEKFLQPANNLAKRWLGKGPRSPQGRIPAPGKQRERAERHRANRANGMENLVKKEVF